MSCSICLSRLKEPVSVPCGHVYCTDCLTAHVSATSPDGFTSNCPSCRETFNMVRPELTCLPKKFHQYIQPSIRRVYIDLSLHEHLRKKLLASDARVKALEKDKERLMTERERHIAAAGAHARGETNALLKTEAEYIATMAAHRQLRAVRERTLNEKDLELDETEDFQKHHEFPHEDLEEELEFTREKAAEDMAEAQEALRAMKVKYDKMKRHCRSLAHREEETGPKEGPSLVGKRNSSLIDLSLDEAGASSPKRLRIIRPLPRSRQSLPHTPYMPGALRSPFQS
ncbi:hypothetical protein DFH06DRAFT_1416212 [Mycena polygramma]|nr:hypothetical protein DFH06DRAFT_1416212 [Mycena polygramma]